MKSFKTFLEANETGGIFSMTPTENPEALPYHPTINPGGYHLDHTRPTYSNPMRKPKPKGFSEKLSQIKKGVSTGPSKRRKEVGSL